MSDSLRLGIELYLRAEGRLGDRKLGPSDPPGAPGKGTAILLETLGRSRVLRSRVRLACVALLFLAFGLQAGLVFSGPAIGAARAGLFLLASLLVLPIASHLRRTWIEAVLDEMIRCQLRDLPLQQAIDAIERIYWLLLSSRRTDATNDAGLGLNLFTPPPGSAAPGEGALSILFLTSDPLDASRLRQSQEIREIQERLRNSKLGDRFMLTQRTAVRPVDLIQALLDFSPDIVHFSGHGKDGAIFLEDDSGYRHRVEGAALAGLFREFGGVVRCVLLSACSSARKARLLAKYTHFVIGSPSLLDDVAAIAFAKGFYMALGAGKSIEEAHRLGCAALKLEAPDHPCPTLFRGDGDEGVSLSSRPPLSAAGRR